MQEIEQPQETVENSGKHRKTKKHREKLQKKHVYPDFIEATPVAHPGSSTGIVKTRLKNAQYLDTFSIFLANDNEKTIQNMQTCKTQKWIQNMNGQPGPMDNTGLGTKVARGCPGHLHSKSFKRFHKEIIPSFTGRYIPKKMVPTSGHDDLVHFK